MLNGCRIPKPEKVSRKNNDYTDYAHSLDFLIFFFFKWFLL